MIVPLTGYNINWGLDTFYINSHSENFYILIISILNHTKVMIKVLSEKLSDLTALKHRVILNRLNLSLWPTSVIEMYTFGNLWIYSTMPGFIWDCSLAIIKCLHKLSNHIRIILTQRDFNSISLSTKIRYKEVLF